MRRKNNDVLANLFDIKFSQINEVRTRINEESYIYIAKTIII